VHTDELCSALTGWLERLMPDGERRAALIAELAGEDDRPVDAEVCAELQARARRHSRHLDVEWVPDGGLTPDTESRGWPAPDPAAVAARRADISAARAGEVGVLTVTGLAPLPLAAPFLDAALAELRGARAVVLDLRANGGGDLDTAMAVLGWLLGPEPVHISDVVSRDHTRRWHSDPRPGLEPGTPAAALIGPGTYSSGEALAYHAQHLLGVTVVGETTRGAADHITPVRLARTVQAHVPEAYVVDAESGGNWEGTGVLPAIECPAAEAPEAAVARLLA
jgi:C-terminal processing protease CtpA/Prc